MSDGTHNLKTRSEAQRGFGVSFSSLTNATDLASIFLFVSKRFNSCLAGSDSYLQNGRRFLKNAHVRLCLYKYPDMI